MPIRAVVEDTFTSNSQKSVFLPVPNKTIALYQYHMTCKSHQLIKKVKKQRGKTLTKCV